MDDRELKDEELESVSGGQRVVVLEKETDGTEGPGHVVLSKKLRKAFAAGGGLLAAAFKAQLRRRYAEVYRH